MLILKVERVTLVHLLNSFYYSPAELKSAGELRTIHQLNPSQQVNFELFTS